MGKVKTLPNKYKKHEPIDSWIIDELNMNKAFTHAFSELMHKKKKNVQNSQQLNKCLLEKEQKNNEPKGKATRAIRAREY